MRKTCGKLIALPLTLIFRSMLHEPVSPEDWKKVMLFQFIKKYQKINYKLLTYQSCLYFSKVFKRLVFKYLFNYFIQYKFFIPCQSGFIAGDSPFSQLLLVTHEIFKCVINSVI